MAENGSDQQQKLAKILTLTILVVPIIVISVVDLLWLVVAFILAVVFLLLLPVFIILSPVLIVLIPVFVILSPVLIILAFIIFSPWLITLVLVAACVIFWIYDYVTGKHPIGADLVDKAREKIGEVAKEVKNKVTQLWDGMVSIVGGGGGD